MSDDANEPLSWQVPASIIIEAMDAVQSGLLFAEEVRDRQWAETQGEPISQRLLRNALVAKVEKIEATLDRLVKLRKHYDGSYEG
jgi:hypothetical protein